MGFLWLMLIGLVAGGLARLLMPGQQSMGLLLTMVLGVVGSVVGGLISSMIFGYGPTEAGIHTSGLVMSTIGALIVLGAYVGVARRSVS